MFAQERMKENLTRDLRDHAVAEPVQFYFLLENPECLKTSLTRKQNVITQT